MTGKEKMQRLFLACEFNDEQESIPVGCVLSAAVAVGGGMCFRGGGVCFRGVCVCFQGDVLPGGVLPRGGVLPGGCDSGGGGVCPVHAGIHPPPEQNY